MAKTRKHYRRGRRSKRRGFASWSLGKKIGAILGGTVALVATAGAVILASKLSKIETTKLDPEALNVSEEARQRGTGYLNVRSRWALFMLAWILKMKAENSSRQGSTDSPVRLSTRASGVASG